MVREYKTKKMNIVCIIHRQGHIFKSFMETENFLNMMKELGISKSTSIFKINMSKQQINIKS